ncbi:MAG: FkbM family methyltransferase [Candidatus Paceibacterota bacterium]
MKNLEIRKNNWWREKFINRLLRLIYWLDNTNNNDFETNGEKNFLEQLAHYYSEPMTVFDVGANLGGYAELFIKSRKRKGDKIHLFEPQKKCQETLSQKFSASPEILLNGFGLSDKEAEAPIYKNREASSLASLYQRDLNLYGITLNVEEKISLSTGAHYVEEKGIKKINLLKIDVEGHELNVLAGFKNYLHSDFIDFIQFEYGGANLASHTNLSDFYQLLNSRGFNLYKMRRHYLEERPYHHRLENFAYQNFVAISQRLLTK